jgi:hypothetical protein
MGKLSWLVSINGVDRTSRVLSLSISQGRQSYRDNYSGGSITCTIQNNDNFAGGITIGGQIDVTISGSGGTYQFDGWISSIEYQDAGGGVGLSTATITGVDDVGRLGRARINGVAFTQALTTTQAVSQIPASALNDVTMASVGGGSSIAQANTYTGSTLNYLNLLNATERGSIYTYVSQVLFVGRNGMANLPTTTKSFGRNPATNVIGYKEFRRIAAGNQYISTFTVSATGITDQTYENTTATDTYGQGTDSSQTLDYNTTQALGNAQWMVNAFDDPNELRFEVDFTDLGNNDSDLYQIFADCQIGAILPLSYRLPGAGSDVTVSVKIEGYRFSANPGQTICTAYLSPATYYQFFTLNSSTLGVLNTSRLGW